MSKKKNTFIRKLLRFKSIRIQLVSALLLLAFLFVFTLILSWQITWRFQKQINQNQHYFQPVESHSHKILKDLQQLQVLFKSSIYLNTYQADHSLKKLETQINQLWKTQLNPSINTLDSLIKLQSDEGLQDLLWNCKKNILQIKKSTQLALQEFKVEYLVSYAPQKPKSSDSTLYYNPLVFRRYEQSIRPIFEEDIQDLIREIIELNQINSVGQNSKAWYQYETAFYLSIFFLVLILVVTLFTIRQISRSISEDLKNFKIYFKDLLNGQIPRRVVSDITEFAPLATLFNKMRSELIGLQKFALGVGEGRYESQTELFGDQGDLGGSLAKMRDNLQIVSEENTIRYWFNNGIAKFSEILTSHADNTQNLADELLANLVEYLEINQGGFFIIEEDQYTNQTLELKSAYAYDKRRFIERTVAPGEGLIGQVWKEAELMYLKEIPKDYVEITSGLGGAIPKTLLIVPLLSGRAVHGIIELASFEDIASYKVDFVRKIAENVGQTIAATRHNEQTRKLLIESQELTKTLQAQDEQMRQNMQELQSTQDLMNRTQKELSEKEANLDALINNTSHAIVAFDKNFNITVVNLVMVQVYIEQGIKLKVGLNLLGELPPEELEESRSEYERALNGEKFEVLRITEKYGQKFFYELHYNPIRDENKSIIGASIFMENITDQKLADMQLKEAQANLTSLINDTEDFIMALDKNYRVIVINEAYQNEYQKRGIDINIGTYIFNFMTSKEERKWKVYYDKALAGERFRKVFESGEYPDKSYRENWFNPIQNEEGQITGFSIFSRDVTESKVSEIKIRRLLLESLEATENLKAQEEQMKNKILEYEKRIKELEEKINV